MGDSNTGDEKHAGDSTLELIRAFYADDAEIQRNFELLYEHAPSTVETYLRLRSSNYAQPPTGALTAREKELVILGMECALLRSNPPPIFHARSAVAAGATAKEIAEVLSLAIMIAGMVTYQESGQYVLAAAVEMLDSQATEQPGQPVTP